MSFSQDLAPHLPFLRRYARALAGNQKTGDSYVAALLEALIEDSSAIQKAGDLRVALFQAFSQVWEPLGANFMFDAQSAPWEACAQTHFARISAKARQAFLLATLERFSRSEVSEILQCDEATTEALLEEASQTIQNGVTTDVLVIEDEPIIAMDIEAILEDLGHAVIGVARTESEAVRLAARKKPGLVLADIQLADGSSGISAVNTILKSFEAPVIFITAFPERLLTGERPEPAYLITKPFMTDMVRAVVSQAMFFNTAANNATAARRNPEPIFGDPRSA